MTHTFDIGQAEQVGRLWRGISGEPRRYYLRDAAELYGLEVTRYKSGNISSATLDGEPISNGAARRLLVSLDGAYIDAVTGELVAPNAAPNIVDRLAEGIYAATVLAAALEPEPEPEPAPEPWPAPLANVTWWYKAGAGAEWWTDVYGCELTEAPADEDARRRALQDLADGAADPVARVEMWPAVGESWPEPPAGAEIIGRLVWADGSDPFYVGVKVESETTA